VNRRTFLIVGALLFLFALAVGLVMLWRGERMEEVAPGDSVPASMMEVGQTAPVRPRTALRVCCDPNNLPFSNERGEGFENRIAELVAEDLGLKLEYTWWAQRRGFIRNTLRAGKCDLVLGVPSSFELALPTRPYYRSTYVFLYRSDAPFQVRSLDDEVLRDLKIGVHLIGDDYANAPPAHALHKRGITNVAGYLVYGDYREPNPPSRLVEAVARREVDVAIIWGPFAGYFAPQQKVALEIVPVSPQIDLPFLPFVYDIAMGVRREDEQFKQEIDAVLERRAPEIRQILSEYGVPRLDVETSASL
jgi:mxaJ protein